jgi:hypothetical protein
MVDSVFALKKYSKKAKAEMGWALRGCLRSIFQYGLNINCRGKIVVKTRGLGPVVIISR